MKNVFRPLSLGLSILALTMGGRGTAFGDSEGETFVLLAEDGANSDDFGRDVAIDGSVAVVGASSEGLTGSVYFFDTATGVQMSKLTPSDGAAQDGFGVSVDIDDPIAVVGAPFRDSDSGVSNKGKA